MKKKGFRPKLNGRQKLMCRKKRRKINERIIERYKRKKKRF